jgi:predicted phosphodiesterase
MTRLAILADIHGNLPALEAVLADLAQFAVDHVIVAGDVVNWGPFSAPVMERVTRAGWAVIRGNNEFYLLDYNTPRQPEHWREFELLPWLHGQLKGKWHRLIAACRSMWGPFCASSSASSLWNAMASRAG